MDLVLHPQWMIGYIDFQTIVFLKRNSFKDLEPLEEEDIISQAQLFLNDLSLFSEKERVLHFKIFHTALKRLHLENKFSELINEMYEG